MVRALIRRVSYISQELRGAEEQKDHMGNLKQRKQDNASKVIKNKRNDKNQP